MIFFINMIKCNFSIIFVCGNIIIGFVNVDIRIFSTLGIC